MRAVSVPREVAKYVAGCPAKDQAKLRKQVEELYIRYRNWDVVMLKLIFELSPP